MQKEKKIGRKTLVKNIVGVVCLMCVEAIVGVVCLMCAAAIVCRRRQILYGYVYVGLRT